MAAEAAQRPLLSARDIREDAAYRQPGRNRRAHRQDGGGDGRRHRGGRGIEHHADVLIYGTGFRIGDLPWAKWVRGRDGRTLDDAWQGSMKAHLGTSVHGFPNLALIHGPNIAASSSFSAMMRR